MARSRSCLASSTPRFEAASISTTSSAVCPPQILAQLSHSPQGSPESPRAEQLRDIASIRASVVLPTPRGPQKRYACPTRPSVTARRSVSETCSWAATSANRRGRYFLANAVWDNALRFHEGWCGSPARRHLWHAVGRDAAREAKKMPQATRSNDHHTYRCYRQGPDGVRGLSPYGPGAPES